LRVFGAHAEHLAEHDAYHAAMREDADVICM
jgi:hypothetical protein